MNKLKCAIIGCRTMGTKHLNALRTHFDKEVSISGILNSSISSSKSRARELGVEYFDSIDSISKENTDIVIVSSPASTHKDICLNILSKGLRVFVEKPFTTDEQGCLDVIRKAKEKNLTLMVGYIEIYNPAVRALVKELNGRKIKKIEALRTTQSYAGNTDVTIIQNLMSHDISVMLALTGLSVSDILNFTTFKPKEENLCTYANVKAVFNNGLEVDLTAKIYPLEKRREMKIVDEKNNIYKINFVDCELSKNEKIIHSGGMSIYEELNDFIKSCVSGKKPVVIGEDGLNVEMFSLIFDNDFKKKYKN